MESMTRAVLYARVSTDAQQKEGTIESQVAELKRQIAAAGHELVKEYIDDGVPGPLLDRPALNQLREDAKTDVYDVVYFLDADRIARVVAYQTIIVGELIKHGKQIIIKGQNYEDNPQNKLTLQMLGVISEYEHAKIIGRMTRGRLHRLRQGQLISTGHRIYGYEYVRKTTTSPCKLVINEEQAPVVRSVFEMFASGQYGLVTICRHLEQRGIVTRTGKKLWDNDRIKTMLTNETYAGTRNYNRMTKAETSEGKEGKRGKIVYRDRSEWIRSRCPPSSRGSSSTRSRRCLPDTTSAIAAPKHTISSRASCSAAIAAVGGHLPGAGSGCPGHRGRCPSITKPTTAVSERLSSTSTTGTLSRTAVRIL
jgi:DNA invertase Pin-like site-specific DNA recombinase